MLGSSPLRIALLLDPLSMWLEEPRGLHGKWGDHAPFLARELIGRGHVVRGFGAPPGFIPRSSDDADEPVAAPLSSTLLRRRIEGFRPDVLLAYDALSPAAFRGARIARRLAASLVLVEAALPTESHTIESALNRIGAWLWGRYVRRTAAAVVALDGEARSQALREGFSPARVRIVPNGVDLTRFRPGLTSSLVARHRIRGRILLYVGGLVQNRGLDLLLTAFARTVGQRSDWNLVLAGSGPRKLILRARADTLGVADRVHWLGEVREEELPGLMGASTLLALPARDADAVGQSIGRALACGLPVLASDLPRLRGLVEDGRHGLLIPSGDEAAWVEALRRAASSPEARKRWSREARAFAEAHLGWSSVAATFEGILLETRRHGPLPLPTPVAEEGPRPA